MKKVKPSLSFAILFAYGCAVFTPSGFAAELAGPVQHAIAEVPAQAAANPPVVVARPRNDDQFLNDQALQAPDAIVAEAPEANAICADGDTTCHESVSDIEDRDWRFAVENPHGPAFDVVSAEVTDRGHLTISFQLLNEEGKEIKASYSYEYIPGRCVGGAECRTLNTFYESDGRQYRYTIYDSFYEVETTRMRGFIKGDLNFDGVVDTEDLSVFVSHFGKASGATLHQGDMNGDGKVGLTDLIQFRNLMGQIEIVPGDLPADLDRDGDVDRADVAVLASNFGLNGATAAEGDMNGDGIVGLADLIVLQRSIGLRIVDREVTHYILTPSATHAYARGLVNHAVNPKTLTEGSIQEVREGGVLTQKTATLVVRLTDVTGTFRGEVLANYNVIYRVNAAGAITRTEVTGTYNRNFTGYIEPRRIHVLLAPAASPAAAPAAVVMAVASKKETPPVVKKPIIKRKVQELSAFKTTKKEVRKRVRK